MRPKQPDLGLDLSRRRTRKAVFLGEMEQVVPWAELLVLIEPHAPRAKTGRSPFDVEVILRIHFLQQWFGLTDVTMEEALFDVPLYRQFAGLGGTSRIPDRVSILRFRHLLERHDLAKQIFGGISELLASRGLMLKEGTAVDATIIATPSSTKNKGGTRDPEMVSSARAQLRTTEKGNQWHFGMTRRRRRTPAGRSRAAGCGHERSEAAQLAHIGVDADFGLVHTVTTTPANAHDASGAHKLLHGVEADKFAGSGYRGAHKRHQIKSIHPDVTWHVAMMPGKRRKLDKGKEVDALTDELERVKARIRSKVEHPFRIVKRQFGHVKTRYRGLAKNTAQLHTLFALANLWMVRKRFSQAAAGQVRLESGESLKTGRYGVKTHALEILLTAAKPTLATSRNLRVKARCHRLF